MTGPVILVVEDDPVMRLVTQKQVSQLGYDCKAVASGEQALEFDRGTVSLIFMDIGLPGLDGIDTTILIRKREKRESRKPVVIVALTAHSDRERCLAAGMNDFLQKPAMLKDFKRVLDKWLSNLGGIG